MSYALHEKISLDIIGSAASPSTLTNAYTDLRQRFDCKKLPNIQLDVKFTPGTNNEVVYVLVEASNDGGSTYFSVPNVSASSSESDVYSDSGTGSTSGIPFVIPGDKTSTATTAILTQIPLSLVCDCIRVSVKSSLGSGFGTIYVKANAQG